jgi:predicted outer membrane repeat protein
MKRHALFPQTQVQILVLLSLILIISCRYYFSSIGQPKTARPGEVINIPINVRVDSTDGAASAFFAICLPEGWTVPADSFVCTGDYSGTIYYNTWLSESVNGEIPPPRQYSWWAAGYGDGGEVFDSGNLTFNLLVKTDSIPGIFYLAYTLGYIGSHGAFGIEDMVKDQFIALLDTPITPPQGDHAYKTVTLDTTYAFKFSDFPFYDQDGHDMIGVRITDIQAADFLRYNGQPVQENEDYLDVSRLVFTPNAGKTAPAVAGFSFRLIDNSFDYSVDTYQMTLNIIDGHDDFYVSPYGYDGNPGSIAAPFRSISQALSVIKASSSDSHTIFISNGLYSPVTTGDKFPLKIKSHVSLVGESEQGVVIDAESSGPVMLFTNTRGITIKNLTVKGGARRYDWQGGGIICRNSVLRLENMTLTGNAANEGGGLYSNGESRLSLSNVTISNNYASWSGGAICSMDCTMIDLSNVNIYENTANRGGGIYAETSKDSTLHMRDVNILRNSAQGVGGIEASGFTLVDGMICDNFSSHEGGIRGNNFSLINVTIANNKSLDGENIIILNHPKKNSKSRVNFVNSIVWGNSPPQMMMEYSESRENYLNIAFSDVQDGEKGITVQSLGRVNWLDGNIETDPVFYDPSAGNYSLMPGSPCVDTGVQDTLLLYNIIGGQDSMIVPRMTYSGSAPDMGASNAYTGIPYFVRGPVKFKGYRLLGREEDGYPVKIILQNLDTLHMVENISADIETEHSCIDRIDYSWLNFGDIPPGDEKESEDACIFFLNSDCIQETDIDVALKIRIYWNNIYFWQDSSRIEDSTFVRIIVNLHGESEPVPKQFELSQNYPNPFNPRTIINYELPSTSQVELSIYNLIGQKVVTLVSGKQQAGKHQIEWDASGFASGVYFYRLNAKSKTQSVVQTRKLVLLK